MPVLGGPPSIVCVYFRRDDGATAVPSLNGLGNDGFSAVGVGRIDDVNAAIEDLSEDIDTLAGRVAF